VTDPRRLLDESPMTRPQVVAIALCVLLNALDGFDVLAISFASPGIAAEWGIDRAALGVVLSMELIGMAFGSVALGAVADRAGRRPTILGCLVVMALGMAAATQAGSVGVLLAIRFVTGLGIGGMLACTNAIVAELANARRRSLAVAIMAAGYPLGAVVGGVIASALLASHGWRSVFVLGAGLTAAYLPLALWLLPESLGFLVQRGRADALDQINRVLARMRHPNVAALPNGDLRRSVPVAELFTPALRRITLLLTVAYFAQLMTFYFMLKWIPKIVVDMGFSPSTAGGVLVWANIGGLAGGIAFGVATLRVGTRRLMAASLLASFAMVAVFGRGYADLPTLAMVSGITGFCTNACMVGLYALVAEGYPAAVRGGGTGFVIGVGRGGAALGPIVAGTMFQSGFGLQSVAIAMAGGSLLALAALLSLPSRSVG